MLPSLLEAAVQLPPVITAPGLVDEQLVEFQHEVGQLQVDHKRPLLSRFRMFSPCLKRLSTFSRLPYLSLGMF